MTIVPKSVRDITWDVTTGAANTATDRAKSTLFDGAVIVTKSTVDMPNSTAGNVGKSVFASTLVAVVPSGPKMVMVGTMVAVGGSDGTPNVVAKAKNVVNGAIDSANGTGGTLGCT